MRRLLSYLGLATALSATAASAGFSSEEVTVFNPIDSIKLAGTLTIPDGSPRAVIVMATGSGLQNRDEELFGHKPFKVIAERLADEGYAVLRMDDRGFGQSEGADLLATSTTDNFVGDILSGLKMLNQRYPAVPAGVIGHSEGGTVAIKMASKPANNVDFIITLAAPAWSGDSIVMSQSREISTRLTGSWEGEQAERQILDIAKAPMASAMKSAMVMQILARQLGDAFKLPEVQKSLIAQIDIMVSPYYVEMISYDPAQDIASIQVPWLALNGDKDTQVLSQNLETLTELNPGVTATLLPGHNHLFQHASTGLPQEYPQITEDISEETLQTIVDWLNTTIK